MSQIVRNIHQYRTLLRGEISTPTRLTLEWLLVGAVRELAGLGPLGVTPEFTGPELLSIANDAVGTAVAAQQAQFGGLQLYIAKQDVLLMLVNRNFAPRFADLYACFSPDGRTACSRALASGRRVIIENVANDDLFQPHVTAASEAGYRAVQSSPLKTARGEVFGMLSTHFAQPRHFGEDELAAMDSHVAQVSDDLGRAWRTGT